MMAIMYGTSSLDMDILFCAVYVRIRVCRDKGHVLIISWIVGSFFVILIDPSRCICEFLRIYE